MKEEIIENLTEEIKYMALIKCTECGKEFSDKALSCPNCGCPTEHILLEIKKGSTGEQKKNIIYEYNILNNKLVVDDKLDKYFKIRAQIQTSRPAIQDKIKQFYFSAKDLDTLIETLPDFMSTAMDAEIEAAISIFVNAKIYDLDANSFYQKYAKEMDVSRIITPLMDLYLEIQGYQEEVQEYHDYVKQVHKNSWSGGGFGIKGALKGHIKAEMMNMGTSFLHSFSDNKNRTQDKVAVIKLKSDIYKSERTKNIVMDAFIQVYDAINNAILLELIEHGIVEGYDFDTEMAYTLIKNIMEHVNVNDKDTIFNICSQAFKADPLFYLTTEMIFIHGLDDNGDATKFAKEYGLYDIYEKRLEEVREDMYRDDLITVSLPGSLATNDSFFHIVDLCIPMLRDGVDVGEYLVEAVFNRIDFDINEEDLSEIKDFFNNPEIKEVLGEENIENFIQEFEDNVINIGDRDKVNDIVKKACISYEKEHHFGDGFIYEDIYRKKYLKETDKYERYEQLANMPDDAWVYAFHVLGDYKEYPRHILAITDLGLYITYEDCEEDLYLTWYNFAQGTLGQVNNGIMINGRIVDIYAEEVLEILKRVRTDLRKYYEEEGIIKKEHVLDEEDSEQRNQMAECVKSVCLEKSKKFHAPIHIYGLKKDIRKMIGYVRAEQRLGLPEDIDIYYLYAKYDDDDMRRGIAVTNLGIYWINGFTSFKPQYLNWNEYKDTKLELEDEDTVKIGEDEALVTGQAKYVFDLLYNIQSGLKKCDVTEKKDIPNDKELPTLDQSHAVSDEQITKVSPINECDETTDANIDNSIAQKTVEELCEDFLSCHDKTIFMIPDKMIPCFGIPNGEKIYIAHDDTLLKTGKNGFIITERGIYCRGMSDKQTYFTSYTNLAKVATIIIKMGEILADDNKVAYYSGSNIDRQDLLNLLKNIQAISKYTYNNLNGESVDSPTETVEKRAETKVCPVCEKRIEITKKFCSQCGYSFIETEKTKVENSKENHAEPFWIMYCGKCGNAIKEGKKFCSQCGTPINLGDGEEKTNDEM